MTAAHFIYVPMVLLLGLAVGYVLGGRAAQVALQDQAASRARDGRRARTHKFDQSKTPPEPPLA